MKKQFLTIATLAFGALVLITNCKKKEDSPAPTTSTTTGGTTSGTTSGTTTSGTTTSGTTTSGTTTSGNTTTGTTSGTTSGTTTSGTTTSGTTSTTTSGTTTSGATTSGSTTTGTTTSSSTSGSTTQTTEILELVYGLVYVKKCNSESAYSYSTVIVPKADVFKAETDLKNKLKSDYPTAANIKTNHSSFYISNATNMCIIRADWKASSSCTYDVYYVGFAKSQSEANSKALKEKNTWAGTTANYEIVLEKSW